MIKKSNPKQLVEIQAEWDALCERRQEIIESGKDFSLLAVTAPHIINEIKELCYYPGKSILDVGCGTGYLTSLLAKHATKCLGIDISATSIALAKKRYSASGADFAIATANELNTNTKFDICISNMVLSCDSEWLRSVRAIFNLLKKDGTFLVMIPHPYNWPKYWGFENASWFSYDDEIYIEHDFSISLAKSLGNATYIHRPLSKYINGICTEGFFLEKTEEPYPVLELPPHYKFDYPRFLFMKFTKNSDC